MQKIKRLKCSLIWPNFVPKHFCSDTIGLEPFMIRLKCAWMRFRSDPIALEPFMIRLKCARIHLWSDFSDQIDLWPIQLQNMVQPVVCSNFRPDPVISVCENTDVRSIGSDHKDIWVCTSTWVLRFSKADKIMLPFG